MCKCVDKKKQKKKQMYYQNEPRFNGVYSRDNLPDDGEYVKRIYKRWRICNKS